MSLDRSKAQFNTILSKKVVPTTVLALVLLSNFAGTASARDYIEKTFRTSGSYTSINGYGCGTPEANASEARLIAEKKVKDLIYQTDMRVKLVDFRYHSYKRDRGKFTRLVDCIRPRECQNHLEVWVDVRMYPDF